MARAATFAVCTLKNYFLFCFRGFESVHCWIKLTKPSTHAQTTMSRLNMFFCVGLVVAMALASAVSGAEQQSKPVYSHKSQLTARSNPNSRLFIGPFGSIASVVSSLGSVGVLGFLLIFLVFLPYIMSLFILPLFGQPAGRSLADSNSYYNNKHKILEGVTFLEEVWRKFDARDTECQKRLLCELHTQESNLGSVGKKLAKAVSYLTFMDGVELPEMIKKPVSEYVSAIRYGREQKECPYVCQFSLKDTIKKMNEAPTQ